MWLMEKVCLGNWMGKKVGHSIQNVITNKPWDVQFKLLPRCYPPPHSLKLLLQTGQWNNFSPILKSLCTSTLWKEFCLSMQHNILENVHILKDQLVYNINSSHKKQIYLTNLLIILANFHIHKCTLS